MSLLDTLKKNWPLILLVLAVAVVVLTIVFTRNKLKENFEDVIGNKNGIANAMELGPRKVYQKPYLNMPQTVPASFDQGYSEKSQSDHYTVDGYKFTVPNENVPNTDEDVNLTDEQIRDKYKNTYMLDPTGELAKYDLSRNVISRYCCPAAYRGAGGGDDGFDPKIALEYANKYVANGYSGTNFNDGSGCLCITPEQAHFFTTRGGNTTV